MPPVRLDAVAGPDRDERAGERLAADLEGTAGRILKDAGAYLSTVVGRMKSDVALYRTLLPEYKRNPSLLVARLLEQARQQILNYPDVTKVFRPSKSEFRILLALDPEQTRIEEPVW